MELYTLKPLCRSRMALLFESQFLVVRLVQEEKEGEVCCEGGVTAVCFPAMGPLDSFLFFNIYTN